MQHVVRLLDPHFIDFGKAGTARLPISGAGGVFLDHPGLAASYPAYRAGDFFPDGHRFFEAEQVGGLGFVPRVTVPDDAVFFDPVPVVTLTFAGQVLGEKFGALRGQKAVVALQAAGECRAVAINVHARRGFQYIQPLLVTRRRHVRRGWGDTEAFERQHRIDPLGADAGIETGNDAAHAVPGEAHFSGGRVVVEDGVEVADMLDKIVRAIQPLAGAEAAPVGGDDVPVLFKFINDELKGGRDVHPAVQQKEGRGIRFAPAPDVQADTVDV